MPKFWQPPATGSRWRLSARGASTCVARVILEKSSLYVALLANLRGQGRPHTRLLNDKISQTLELRRRSQYEHEVASTGGLAVVRGMAARVHRKQPLALIQLRYRLALSLQ